MTTIHVIDDNDAISSDLAEALGAMLEEQALEVDVATWASVRELERTLHTSSASAPEPGDVAVCDLFSIDHYEDEASNPPRYYSRVASRPRSSENVKRATLDSIKTSFPVLVEHGLRLVVFSYVFKLLESTNDPSGAAQVREELLAVGVHESDVFEKPEREVARADIEPVIGHVLAIVGARA